MEETKDNENEIEMFPSESVESEEQMAKRKKREVLFELALFLALGILLGITIKTEAAKRITIGFNDYKITGQKNAYDVAQLQKNLEQQAAAEQAAQQQVQPDQTTGQTAPTQQ